MKFLVSVTRTTVYRVEAENEAAAAGSFTDDDEVDQTTTEMFVEPDFGDEPVVPEPVS